MSIAEKKLAKDNQSNVSRKMSVCHEEPTPIISQGIMLLKPANVILGKAGSFRVHKRSNSILGNSNLKVNAYQNFSKRRSSIAGGGEGGSEMSH